MSELYQIYTELRIHIWWSNKCYYFMAFLDRLVGSYLQTGTRANRPKKDPWQSYRRVAAKDRTNELAISVVTIDSRDR